MIRPKSALKVGINTWLSDKVRLEQIINLVSNLGFDGVEISGYPGDFSSNRRSSVRKLIRENGLDTVSISVGVPFYRSPQKLNLHASNPDVRKTSVRYVCDCVDLASDLEGELVYVCSVSKDQKNHLMALENFSASLTDCAQYAEAAGLRIALEPFPHGQLPKTEDAVRLASKLGLRNLGLLLDTGHLLLGRESLKKSAEMAKRFLMHVHINNNDGLRDTHWPPQTGRLTTQDFSGFVGTLERIGYDKYISAELANVRSIERSLSSTMKFLLSLLKGRDDKLN